MADRKMPPVSSFEGKKYLVRRDAILYLEELGLPLTKSTLEEYSSEKGKLHKNAPPFRKIGTRILYVPKELQEYVESRTVRGGS